MSNTKKTPELARYATVETTALIETYCDWIEAETGRRPDAWSVYVGSQLRGPFQKSDGNQKRLAAEAKARADEAVAKAARKAEREKAAQAKATAAPKADPRPKAKAVRSTAAKPATSKATPATTPARRRPARVAQAATTETASA